MSCKKAYSLLEDMNYRNALIIKAVPTVVALGCAWLGLRLLKNESRLLHRQIELEMALAEKSRKQRQRLLIGN